MCNLLKIQNWAGNTEKTNLSVKSKVKFFVKFSGLLKKHKLYHRSSRNQTVVIPHNELPFPTLRSLQNPTMASITTTTASQFYKQVTITPPNVQKSMNQGVSGGTTTMRIGGTLPGMYPTFSSNHTGTVAPSKLSGS